MSTYSKGMVVYTVINPAIPPTNIVKLVGRFCPGRAFDCTKFLRVAYDVNRTAELAPCLIIYTKSTRQSEDDDQMGRSNSRRGIDPDKSHSAPLLSQFPSYRVSVHDIAVQHVSNRQSTWSYCGAFCQIQDEKNDERN